MLLISVCVLGFMQQSYTGNSVLLHEWSFGFYPPGSVAMSLCFVSIFYVTATTPSCSTDVTWFVVLIKLQTLESHFTCLLCVLFVTKCYVLLNISMLEQNTGLIQV